MEEAAKEKKIDEERTTLRKQMALEEQERRDIDDIKAEEKEQAEKEVYDTFAAIEKEKIQKQETQQGQGTGGAKKKVAKVVPPPPPSGVYDVDIDALDEEDIDSEGDSDSDIWDDDEVDGAPEDGENDVSSTEEYDDDDLETNVPAPRTANVATFKYTPRLFKTPMRESTIKTEKEFVAKNRPHLHNNGLLNKDALDIGEGM